MTDRTDKAFEAYAKRMQGIRMPPRTRSSIESALDAQRHQRTAIPQLNIEGGATTQANTRHATARKTEATMPHAANRRQQRTTRRRILAVAACTAALALGTLVLSTTGSLPFDIPGFSDKTSATDGTNSSSFVLAAYAEGTPVPNSKNIVVSPESFFNGSYSWSEGDPEIASDGHTVGTMRISFGLDLRCNGNDISSLTYRLEGDGQDRIELERLGSRAYTFGNGTLDEERGRELTVDSTTRMQESSFGLIVDFLMPDSLSALNDQINANPDDDSAYNAYRAASFAHAAGILNGQVLSITATHDAGTTETQRYRIAPVEDFESKAAAWFDSGQHGLDSSLFTIERLS